MILNAFLEFWSIFLFKVGFFSVGNPADGTNYFLILLWYDAKSTQTYTNIYLKYLFSFEYMVSK